MRRLGATLAALLVWATPAFCDTLEVLIEERARADYGDALPDTGAFDITVKGAPSGDVVTLAEFWMDIQTGRFLANAVLATGDVERIGGLALVTVPVPVPARRLLPDEIVQEADLAVVHLPMGRVGSYVITDAQQIVGKQVRRVLSSGRPIQAQSIIEPLVIDRGDQVEIVFTDGLLALTSPGRALSDAHVGQEVRIVNLVSNKTITAIATGNGTVEVLR